MRIGIVASGGGARDVVDLAVAAEEHGWDGFFGWDGVDIGPRDTFDPWGLLSAAAVRTERVVLGAMVFVPARRRPWVLARQALTVDHLSQGRLVLPVGLGVGDDRGFAAVRGEAGTPRERAELLDEALAVLDLAFGGDRFEHHGTHHDVDGMQLRPLPVQRPRPPVWVVGAWPSRRSLARAARWDGVVTQGLRTEDELDVGALTELVATVRALRAEAGLPLDGYEVVLQGVLPADPAAAAHHLAALADAGATWWVESAWDEERSTVDALRARIRRGPAHAG
ncbi:Flavin-dependent oxidoreductase, luciferase family (includes alkanesulfonate monooxygenase SsuD and methylene tetrahydromethanopterin reductase) [Cellulomonas marina]|uniref:Flavin-dependent oxidoreductase, luciferase family (Includes alkanesulfonate monooxygenase SsuD and methylene tetrahydromethanopterin reductase) n=1 Tax=Cellulomonas marina TaxID=988821 RepID=A0A1I0W112_9CELL|nr:Flavin-dependent oxidoreductase, luciferase family (includes alkanesulfonate monooxygenase SsuD and methylene tetrahydromethanopterin reductase) [Cellulomonas marina]